MITCLIIYPLPYSSARNTGAQAQDCTNHNHVKSKLVLPRALQLRGGGGGRGELGNPGSTAAGEGVTDHVVQADGENKGSSNGAVVGALTSVRAGARNTSKAVVGPGVSTRYSLTLLIVLFCFVGVCSVRKFVGILVTVVSGCYDIILRQHFFFCYISP